ncbi:MAG: citrate/2-methylcitrate synthase [Acidimicrobiia bacterium]
MAPRMLTSNEAAKRLGVKPQTLYAYVSRGMLERHVADDGRSSRFDAAEVERLAKKGRGGGTTPANDAAIDVVISTELTAIAEGRLYYRGREVVALADDHRFEQVAEWLWTGELGRHTPDWPLDEPTTRTGAAVAAALAPTARLADRIRTIAAAIAPHDAFRFDLRPESVVVSARTLVNHVVESLPLQRPLPAKPKCLADRLWPRLTDKAPFPGALDLLDAALVLVADHELAASTLAARIAASTRADPYAVVGAGLGAFGGPLHGSASDEVHRTFERAAAIGDAEGVVADQLRQGRFVAGFGQRLYPDGDPRAIALLARLDRSGAPRKALATVHAVREAASRRVPVRPNVDYGLAALTFSAGMGADAGEALFAIGRMAGWIAHAMEEYSAAPLRLRPRAVYVGPAPTTVNGPASPRARGSASR